MSIFSCFVFLSLSLTFSSLSIFPLFRLVGASAFSGFSSADLYGLSSVMSMTVLNPSFMTSTATNNNKISYIPWLNSKITSTNNITGRVVLPNSHDNYKGCDQNGQPVPFSSTLDDGTSTEGTILIVQFGGCQPNFAGLGLAAAIIFDNWGIPYVEFISGSSTPFDIPVLTGISSSDMNYLISYLSTNSSWTSSGRVIVSIPGVGEGGLVDSEKQALRQLANNLGYTAQYTQNAINAFGPKRSYLSSYPTSPSYDPCTDPLPIGGIYCVGGHIVLMSFSNLGLVGVFPSSLGAFTQLRYLDLGSNKLSGPMTADSICTLNLLYFLNVQQNMLTSFADCFQTFVNLQQLKAANNKINNFPLTLFHTASTLNQLDLSSNSISFFPDVSTLVSLQQLKLFSNNGGGSLGLFSSMKSLQQLDVHGNQLVQLPVSALDNLPSLQQVDLSFNNFTGPLPALANTPNIQTLALDHNNFVGDIPASWSLASLQTLTASHNQITYGVTGAFPLTLLPQITYYDLSYNNISVPKSFFSPGSFGWGSFLCNYMSGPKLASLKLDGNAIAGPWVNSAMNTQWFPSLTYLSLSHNMISSIDPNWFSGVFPPLTHLDVSYNALVGSLPSAAPAASCSYLNLAGNGLFSSPQLPSWIVQSVSSFHSTANLPFQCPDLSQDTNPSLALSLDPVYYQYRACVCENGYYGVPPSCAPIPATVVDASGSTYNITDQTFGNQRYSSGIDTNWLISPGVSTRILTITVTIFPSVFYASPSNQLTILDGNSTASPVVTTFTGDTTQALNSGSSSSTLSSGVSSKSAAVAGVTETYNVIVLNSACLINFRSKDTSGQHFILSVTAGTECPYGYMFDITTNKCQLQYSMVAVYQIVVYVFSALVSLFILVVMAVIIKHIDSVIIKAASAPYCLLILSFLLIMSIGSIFYALQPSPSNSAVCHLRAWFTGSSVIGVLAALLTKTNRIRRIFNNTKAVLTLSNTDLLWTLMSMLSFEFLLLVVYSSLSSLSQSFSRVIDNNGSNEIVTVCTSPTDNAQAMAWMLTQFVYVSLFLGVGTFIAFTIRNVPSAFNESSHILQCLEGLLTLGFIVVLVQFITENNPASLVVLRGLGQALTSLVLTLAIFGPKLFYIFEGQANDKSLVSTNANVKSKAGSSDDRRGSTITASNLNTALNDVAAIERHIAKLQAQVAKLKRRPSDALPSKGSALKQPDRNSIFNGRSRGSSDADADGVPPSTAPATPMILPAPKSLSSGSGSAQRDQEHDFDRSPTLGSADATGTESGTGTGAIPSSPKRRVMIHFASESQNHIQLQTLPQL